MKKALKITGKILLGLLILLAVFLLSVFVCNKIMMKNEAPLLEKPLGQLVEIDGKNMCVYTEGSGDKTILFLSGSGTVSPILDFRTLGSRLKDEYKLVVIEKFGYGFSDIDGGERSFDTILRQDREALAKLGIEAPFILCPHSMSGLEAIMWAQDYPDEVEAIIGLDVALPRSYDGFDFAGAEKYEKLGAAAREMGLIRLFYTDKALPQELTADEKKLYKALAAKIAVNEDVINEGSAVPAVCADIDGKPLPDIPTLLFVSDGKEVADDNWAGIQRDYASKLSDCKVIELDCGHYVHNFEADRISAEIKDFISQH